MSKIVDEERWLSPAQWRLIGLASLGGSLEFYDFIIYGIFAQYISKQFFPASDPFVSMILSLSVLALGYFARPIGGIALGWFGDRIGRRPVFVASLGLTTVATILIGLLPNYSQWGVAAPLLLVVLRLVQGMCLGGELPGALVYAIEAAPKRAGLACGVIILCVNAGVLVATIVNLVVQRMFSPAEVADYGWRVAFLLGGAIGVVSFLLRRKLEESPEFLKLHANVERHPLRELMRHHTREMLVAAGIAAAIAGFNGILYGFIPAYLGQTLQYAPTDIAISMTAALLTSSVGLIIAGWAGDYLSGRMILRVGAGLLVVTVWPLMKLIATHGGDLVLLMVLLSGVFSITSGIWPSLLASQFPTRVRFSGIAMSYNITVTLLSGLAPLAGAALIRQTGDPASPALYVAATALISFVATFFIRTPRLAAMPALATT
jgi:MFS transporter, MHS family, proline/betaine transporter